jgi:hypothetical protein
MLPLVKGQLPDFGPVFEPCANDLKREAERVRSSSSMKKFQLSDYRR